MCYKEALKSPDPSTQYGALALDVRNRALIVKDCNKLPPGVEGSLLDRSWKLKHIEHAERNVIYKILRNKVFLRQPVMFAPGLACCDCARAIVLSGIKKVVYHKQRLEATPDVWRGNIEEGTEILKKGGVEIDVWSGRLNLTPILINGLKWIP